MSEIRIEKTGNGDIVKFVFEKIITQNSFEYNSIDDAENSNLVQQLFHFPFVKKVFITANFIAIEKFDILEWEEVQEEIREMLVIYTSTNDSIFSAVTTTKAVIEVYAEGTPNPNVQKFVTNKLLTSQNVEVLNRNDAKDVPLALELFEFPFVKEVFISSNYISIMKNENIDWFEINTEIRDFIKEYLQSNRRVVSENYEHKVVNSSNSKEYQQTNDDISKQIIAILEEHIKPAVAGDGGNIQFLSYIKDTKEVNVVLQGACNGCPSSTMTLKNGIEATLKHFLPGKIESVNALN